MGCGRRKGLGRRRCLAGLGGGWPKLSDPGATEHGLERRLDQEEEEDDTELTVGILTSMEQRRRCAAVGGRRRRGRSKRRELRSRLRAPGRRGGVLVVLIVKVRDRGD
jgi:hypothetical protein